MVILTRALTTVTILTGGHINRCLLYFHFTVPILFSKRCGASMAELGQVNVGTPETKLAYVNGKCDKSYTVWTSGG